MNEQVLLEIRAIAGDARRELGALARDLALIGQTSPTSKIRVDTGTAMRQLAVFRAALLDIDQKDVNVQTNIDIAETIAQIEALKWRLRELDGKKVDISVRRSVLSDISALERRVVSLTKETRKVSNEGTRLENFFLRFGRAGTTSRVFAQISKNIGDVVRYLPIVGPLISEVGQSILAFGSRSSTAFLSVVASVAAAGVAIIGFVVVINYLMTLLSALIALLAAVVASLAMAAAGFGALAVGAAGALAPAILVLIVLFSRLNAIMQARQARETALKQAARDRNQQELQSIQTAERLHNAHKQVADAEQAVQDAHQNLRDAFKQGMQEMEDAAQDLTDALLGVEDAELGVAEARLGIREAEFELKRFRREAKLTGVDWADLLQKAENVDFNPQRLRGILEGARTRGGRSLDEEQQLRLERLILNVRRAKLQEKESNNTLVKSETTLARSRAKNNDFVKRGVRAYRPYLQALRQVKEANNRLDESEHDLANTQKQIRLEAQTQTSAMAEYNRQRSKLTKTEQEFLDNLNHVFDALKKVGHMMTDPIFRAANSVFDALRGKTGGLKDGFEDVGDAFGDWVKSFGDFLAEPNTLRAFQIMAHGAASLIRSLGSKATTDFFRIMRNIAVAVMPNLIRKGNSIARTFRRWADGSSNLVDLKKKLDPLVEEFDTWWDIIKLLAEDFLAFVRDARGPSKSISESIRGWLRNLRRFLDSKRGREEVRKWIENAKETAVDFWNALKSVVHWLRLIGSAAEDTLGPLGKLLEIWDKLSNLKDKLPGPLKDVYDVVPNPKNVSPLYNLGKKFGLWHTGGPHDYAGLGGFVPGEYTIRAAVATQLGMPFMDALNAGQLTPALMGAGTTGGRGDVNIDKVEVSSPDGGYPDGRHAAVMLAQELRRLGASS